MFPRRWDGRGIAAPGKVLSAHRIEPNLGPLPLTAKELRTRWEAIGMANEKVRESLAPTFATQPPSFCPTSFCLPDP